MSKKVQFDDINNIKRLHKGHWFNQDIMRFFKSKVYPNVVKKGKLYYFISSEKGPDMVRKYSVRTMSESGEIDTLGDFQAHRSKRSAERALAKHVGLDKFYA